MAVSRDAQRRGDRRITEFLAIGFPVLERLTIGFYWPVDAEVDPRPAVDRFRARGAAAVLPVVVGKHSALEFRSWAPGAETMPGVHGRPAPPSPAAVPDVILMSPLGFDGRGYRLGDGGGYLDRTLAGLDPQPLKIGLARGVNRIDTIRPQPHDIPMDFVITEEGVYVAGAEGLQLEDDLAAVAARAEDICESGRQPGRMEVASLLNRLLEAERAGAKVMASLLSQPSLEPGVRESLLRIQRDESRNCAILIGLLRHIDAAPSSLTGDFLQMALAIQGNRERLAFLNRGQTWVARHIAAALPRIGDPRVRNELRAMEDSHMTNIGICNGVLDAEPVN